MEEPRAGSGGNARNKPPLALSNCVGMRRLPVFVLVAALSTAFAQVREPAGLNDMRAQSAADLIAQAAGTHVALLPAGLLKPTSESGDLASMLLYSTEEIVVVRISGQTLREALERSLSNLPDLGSSFLHPAGLTVTFSPSAPAGSRVVEIRVDGETLQESKGYDVAMPASVARGALGFFKLWDKSKIVRETGASLESVLKGKVGGPHPPRYLARP